jgi:hypothetical protein
MSKATIKPKLDPLQRERDTDAVLSDLAELSREWDGPVDAAALIRADRDRAHAPQDQSCPARPWQS